MAKNTDYVKSYSELKHA